MYNNNSSPEPFFYNRFPNSPFDYGNNNNNPNNNGYYLNNQYYNISSPEPYIYYNQPHYHYQWSSQQQQQYQQHQKYLQELHQRHQQEIEQELKQKDQELQLKLEKILETRKQEIEQLKQYVLDIQKDEEDILIDKTNQVEGNKNQLVPEISSEIKEIGTIKNEEEDEKDIEKRIKLNNYDANEIKVDNSEAMKKSLYKFESNLPLSPKQPFKLMMKLNKIANQNKDLNNITTSNIHTNNDKSPSTQLLSTSKRKRTTIFNESIFSENYPQNTIINKNNDSNKKPVSPISSNKTILMSTKNEFKCGWRDCIMDFNELSKLGVHIDEIHVSKSKCCDWVGCERESNKPFSSKQNLSNHIRYMHTGEKNLKCDQCNHTCVSNSHLRSHKSTIHKIF